MWRLAFATILCLALVAGACSAADRAESEPVPSSQTVVPLETTSSIAASGDASVAVDVTTSSLGVRDVAVCAGPRLLVKSDPEPYVRLHGAVSEVVESTNELGAALVAVRDFSSDWRDDPAVSGIVGDLLEDMQSVEVVSAEILEGDLGAVYDAERVSWVFPAAMQPLTPAHGNLEELAMASQVYEDVILATLFSTSSLGEAVTHWNIGGSPCSHAQGLVERLHGTHALFVPYWVAHDDVFVGTQIGMNDREVGGYDELMFAGAPGAPGNGEVILFRRWNADGAHEDLVLVRRAGGTVTDGLALTGDTEDVWLGIACKGQNPVLLVTTDGTLLRSWSVGEDWKLHETSISGITEAEVRSACVTNSVAPSEG